MKVLGIIAEYNPFHNGHLYHLQASKALIGADCVVVVMSGNFTQRGEPAVVDKWARTEMALLCGVDLIIELPVPYAMSSAEYFALGAVKLLDSLGAIDSISFGSESGDLDSLSEIAAIITEEPPDYKAVLKESLSLGNSFPAARQKALSACLKAKHGKDTLSNSLKSPNNILAIEYLKALKRLNSTITPITISRVGNDYSSVELTGKISSASSIRNVLSNKPWQAAKELLISSMPSSSMTILEREIELGKGPIFPSDFTFPLLSTLRSMSADEISALPYMEEGLENRIRIAAKNSGSYQALLDNICTKRYPITRIQRILFSLLTGLKKDMFEAFNTVGGPAYIRILGFNDTGRRLLSAIKGKTGLPVVTKTADFKNSMLANVSEMLRLEANATDQYVLGCKNPSMRKSGSEFKRNSVYFTP